jgi:pimeloyl-ACP methyl ester carboxylesterase
VGRIALILVMSLLVGTFALAAMLGHILLLWSPGKPKPFVDEHGRPLAGSISEKIRVNINGVRQGMFIKSKDGSSPVLLVVHGGPGMPDYFLTQRYSTGLENYFTVVWWEQRGTGLSYRADIPRETMTAEQFIADTLEVTNYLRHHFGKDKIYLLGHSWGSYLAIQAAAKAPELYHAYIGMAQVSYQLKSELLAHEYMLDQFGRNGNRAMVRKLEAAPVTMTDGTSDAYLAVRDGAMHRLGIGTTHDMKSVITGVFFASWRFREYTLDEKVNLWRGRSFSRSFGMWDKMIRTDLTEQVPELKIPVYFFSGIHDYTVSYVLSKDYLERLRAPLKGFYTFPDSAHSPILEEPRRAEKIFREDVLAGANSLADTDE